LFLAQNVVRDVANLFAKRLRVDTALKVVGNLFLAATVGLINGASH
jgi:hypothetical protein